MARAFGTPIWRLTYRYFHIEKLEKPTLEGYRWTLALLNDWMYETSTPVVVGYFRTRELAVNMAKRMCRAMCLNWKKKKRRR